MQNTKIFKIIATVALATGVLVSGFTASAANISLIPAAQNVLGGDTFAVDIIAGNLPAGTSGGGLDINWIGDATLDSVYLATTDPADSNGGTYLGGWDPVSSFLSGTGTIDNGTSSLTGLFVGSFFGLEGLQAIGRLNFTLGTGTVTMSLMDSVVSGGWSAWDGITDPFDFTNTYIGTTINPINPVPVPAALWLFGSGLIGLMGVARRRS
jgi:hypothetical protein